MRKEPTIWTCIVVTLATGMSCLSLKAATVQITAVEDADFVFGKDGKLVRVEIDSVVDTQIEQTLGRLHLFAKVRKADGSTEMRKGDLRRIKRLFAVHFIEVAEDERILGFRWRFDGRHTLVPGEKKFYFPGTGKADKDDPGKPSEPNKPPGLFAPKRYSAASESVVRKNDVDEIVDFKIDHVFRFFGGEGVRNDKEKISEDMVDDPVFVRKWMQSVERHIGPGTESSSLVRWWDKERKKEIPEEYPGRFVDTEVELGSLWRDLFWKNESVDPQQLGPGKSLDEYYSIWETGVRNRVRNLTNFDSAVAGYVADVESRRRLINSFFPTFIVQRVPPLIRTHERSAEVFLLAEEARLAILQRRLSVLIDAADEWNPTERRWKQGDKGEDTVKKGQVFLVSEMKKAQGKVASEFEGFDSRGNFLVSDGITIDSNPIKNRYQYLIRELEAYVVRLESASGNVKVRTPRIGTYSDQQIRALLERLGRMLD